MLFILVTAVYLVAQYARRKMKIMDAVSFLILAHKFSSEKWAMFIILASVANIF